MNLSYAFHKDKHKDYRMCETLLHSEAFLNTWKQLLLQGPIILQPYQLL
jgi:hypothetical protein